MTEPLDPAPPGGTKVRSVTPLDAPPKATIRPPGSKSLTNRALLVASLAEGRSVLRGALVADDTAAMVDCVRALGAQVDWPANSDVVTVDGVGGRPHRGPVHLAARLSGTTARFALAACALGEGPYEVDGDPPLRHRPMDGSLRALEALGCSVTDAGGHLPAVVTGGPRPGGRLRVAGDVSSQYLSGLAMAGACMRDGLEVSVEGALVSLPYVSMTLGVMEAFGADATFDDATGELRVAPGGYRGAPFAIEADASAASYFLAVAAVTGGRVRIEGVGSSSVQGDAAFADVLAQMGAEVTWGEDWVEVGGPPPGELRGIGVNLAALSDTAPTLAAVAVFANSPTEVTGVGFIRAKETDRIAAVVTELQRLGIQADATSDGFRIHPGRPRHAAVRTYDDHRMAMAFSVVGLASGAVDIVDPDCVAKTYPGFFADVERLRSDPSANG